MAVLYAKMFRFQPVKTIWLFLGFLFITCTFGYAAQSFSFIAKKTGRAAVMRPPWQVHGPLRVSKDGHYFEFADGTPWFWLADTAWSLHENMSRADVKIYLNSAASADFNVVQLMSVNDWALIHSKNYYGDAPYENHSAAKLNLPYWRYLGWVIDQAAQRGLYVLLVYGAPGRSADHRAVAKSPAEAYAYGRALGTLYKSKPNIIWAGGMDVNPDDPRRVGPMGMAGWKAMAEGIADGVNGVDRFDGKADWSTTLMTYHPGWGSSSKWFQKARWLDFNGAQVGVEGDWIIKTVASDYAKKPAKPIIVIEPSYEDSILSNRSVPVSAAQVRQQAYQSVFAGACGYTYGNSHIYKFDSPIKGGGKWRQALSAPGRMQMQFLRRLMEPKLFQNRVPWPDLIVWSTHHPAPPQQLNRWIAATGAADGSWAMIYSPRGAPFTVDLTRFCGPSVHVRWYNPRNGHYRPLQSLRNRGKHQFDPPGTPAQGNDWVMIAICTMDGAH